MSIPTHSAPLPKVGDRVIRMDWGESGEVRGILPEDGVYVVRHWFRRRKSWAYECFSADQWADPRIQSWGPKGWNKERAAIIRRRRL